LAAKEQASEKADDVGADSAETAPKVVSLDAFRKK
jgi:hypothetical protein